MQRLPINLVWFKRDLRLTDHAPLNEAIQLGLPVLLLYIFEPSLLAAPESDDRHSQFIFQSLTDLNQQLEPYGHRIHIIHDEVISIIDQLNEVFQIQHLLSHQETGMKITFDRDRAVKRFCREKGIIWQEYLQDGVFRGLSHRQNWKRDFNRFMNDQVQHPILDHLHTVDNQVPILKKWRQLPLPKEISAPNPQMQQGGMTLAKRYFHSFFQDRIQTYSRHLSKPSLSRRSCSRLSACLAFGNLSPREVWQKATEMNSHPLIGWHAKNFQSRLWWRCHYMQKLESQWQIEFDPINPGFKKLDRHQDATLFKAWSTGHTGYPMVDASMRCLISTGWLNFRMRAMLATFACFALWLDWKLAATHLARTFLDFEPGIHFPQFQMQAGLTGYHPLRIFNPLVQAKQHDPQAAFIKQWLPELSNIPVPLIFEPWKMTTMDQAFFNCQIGKEYPNPIINYDELIKINKDKYWKIRNLEDSILALPKIWHKLCLPDNIQSYKQNLGSNIVEDPNYNKLFPS